MILDPCKGTRWEQENARTSEIFCSGFTRDSSLNLHDRWKGNYRNNSAVPYSDMDCAKLVPSGLSFVCQALSRYEVTVETKWGISVIL